MDSTKKKTVKPKVKKPKVKKPKVKKPKVKTKQKQKQTQTTRVTVNIGDMKKKTTRRRTNTDTRGRKNLSTYYSPHPVINPVIIRDSQQQQQLQQPNITLLDLERREEKLKSGIKEGFVKLAQRIDESSGNLATIPSQITENIKKDYERTQANFEENERLNRQQEAGSAEFRRDPFESSSSSPAPAPAPAPAIGESSAVVGVALKKIPKTQIGEKIQAKIEKFIKDNNKQPDRKTVLNYANNNDFKALQITRDDIRDYIEKSGQYPIQKKGRKKKN